jgi:hypothetical protein
MQNSLAGRDCSHGQDLVAAKYTPSLRDAHLRELEGTAKGE